MKQSYKTITINFTCPKQGMGGHGGFTPPWRKGCWVWKNYRRIYIYSVWTPFCIIEWK